MQQCLFVLVYLVTKYFSRQSWCCFGVVGVVLRFAYGAIEKKTDTQTNDIKNSSRRKKIIIIKREQQSQGRV